LINDACGNFTITQNSTGVLSKKLGGQLCNSSFYCPMTESIFSSEVAKVETCTEKTVQPSASRYPGEACDKTSTCINSIECTSANVCAFVKNGDGCNKTQDCGLGAFCNLTIPTPTNGTLGICTAQVKAGAGCTDDWMCPQSQGCLKGNCTDYYSRSLGDDVSTVVPAKQAVFCLSKGASTDGKCTGLSYQNVTNMTANKDGLVTCKIGDTCLYTDFVTKQAVNKPCQCSYDNQGGRSFCPKAYTEGDKNWNLLASAARSFVSNTKCHTLTRFSCWDKPQSALTNTYDASVNTDKAAQLFYAEDCIKKLFAAGEFLRLSFVVLAALLFSLI